MYQPRRASAQEVDVIVAADRHLDGAERAAAFVRPRRQLRTWKDNLADHASPAMLAIAASATVGALAFQSATAPAAAMTVSTSASDAVANDSARILLLAAMTGQNVVPQSNAALAMDATNATIVGVKSPDVRPPTDEEVAAAEAAAAQAAADEAAAAAAREAEAAAAARAEALAAAGIITTPCSRGNAVESGLRQNTINIYRSLCALFPEIKSFGGVRSDSMQWHPTGRALDNMLTPYKDHDLGMAIANYLIAHAKEFNINHIIFEQKIWMPSRPYWTMMSDRGSVTANHFDHVHVAVNS